MMKPNADFQALVRQSRIQPSYLDVNHKRQTAPVETLLALLQQLGVAIDRPQEAAGALAELRRRRLARGVEPVLVAWNGRLKAIDVALPEGTTGGLEFELDLDDRRLSKVMPIDSLRAASPRWAGGWGYALYKAPLLNPLPTGYHRLRIEAGSQTMESLVISAPRQTYLAAAATNDDGVAATGPLPAWGAFMPLYAVRRDGDWGIGDFTSLGRLAEWTGNLGGAAVGTLPLLAAALDEPFEPSPYRPVSRQFWNELYIDVASVPELDACPSCRELIASDDVRRQRDSLRAADLVDYREVMGLKRRALSKLAAHFFEVRPAERFAAFERFRVANAEVDVYARFRAAQYRQRTGWQAWPTGMQRELCDGDFDETEYRYQQYVQWIAAEQLTNVQQRASAKGCGLYLDLPVGVDAGGYDVWRNKDLFVVGTSTGAPPDPFFSKGQDWGLPPLHPERIRDSGYRHLRDVLAANMQYARYLRVDHAMGWHRLYWIAPGLRADQGAYIGYEADEFYAVASIESHRHRCTLLAENLGTVPPEVGKALLRHGIGGMWVAPYELEPSRRHALSEPPPLSVASLNTHDMPTAAAWWTGRDADQRRSLGLITDEQAHTEREDRRRAVDTLRQWLRTAGYLPLVEEAAEGDAPPVAALLRAIAASAAQLVLVTLEDLWLETEPQNVPGTLFERPNWRHKAKLRLEEFTQLPEAIDLLSELNHLRRRRGNTP